MFVSPYPLPVLYTYAHTNKDQEQEGKRDWLANEDVTDLIDKTTLEIKQDPDKTTYKNLEDIAEDLPDHAPRFILLSYPLTLVSPNFSFSLSSYPFYTFLSYQTEQNKTKQIKLTQPQNKQSSGRLSVPYVLIYYMPVTCNAELRMLYASAKELMRNTAEVGKVLEIDSVDDLEEIPEKLGAT